MIKAIRLEFKKHLEIPLVIYSIQYGIFSIYKKANDEMLYEDHVQQTVKDMVKPECPFEDCKKQTT
ncbi:MAG: hypothetical protein OEX12_11575 [Gammaproteobacteria bacterium]|nr:hypothetical protein [Gammaproteobacteria bacterium]